MTEAEAVSTNSIYSLRAVDRVCDVLDILADSRGPVSLITVAEMAGLPKSSAFRYLAVLEGRGYVSRDEPSGSFELGPAFRLQNTRVVETLAHFSRPVVENLRDKLQETVNIGILDGTSIVYLVVAESPHRMRVASRVGERGYIHSTAIGKAICSRLPEARVRSILARSGLAVVTPNTIVDQDSYLRELQEIRDKGYALDDGEDQLEGRCVAVVIPGLEIQAGVSVSAPMNRLSVDAIDGVAKELSKAAKAIANAINSSGEVPTPVG